MSLIFFIVIASIHKRKVYLYLQSYDVGHAAALTGVIHTRAATYTSSKDHTIKVLEPSLSPGVIAEYRNNKSEICRVNNFLYLLTMYCIT